MKLLWVKTDFLHPTMHGGRIRSLETLKRLHQRHVVHYLAYSDPEQPEGVQRGLIGEVLSRFERKGLRIARLTTGHIPETVAREHYAHLKDKPFFDELVEYMTSGMVAMAIIEGPNAIAHVRSLIGAGFAGGLEVPIFNVNDSIVQILEGDMSFLQIDVEYQQRLNAWLALRVGVTGLARSGTETSTLLSEGLAAVYGIASLAASTARRQSSRPPELTSAMVSSVAGFSTASFLPEADSHQAPLMYSWRFLTGTADMLDLRMRGEMGVC